MLRVTKPGGHLLCFGGTRTFHRMAVNIEDAGWEIRDTIMYLFGSGFPKSHSISKAIDKKFGKERKVIVIDKQKLRPNKQNFAKRTDRDNLSSKTTEGWKGNGTTITATSTSESELWEGYGTALKPAYEPIIVAMKPLDSNTYASNALEHDVAGINIDDTRILYDKNNRPIPQIEQNKRDVDSKKTMFDGQSMQKSNTKAIIGGSNIGRWPANVILQHHSDCVYVGIKKVKGPKSQEPYDDSVNNPIRMNASKKINRNQHTDEDGFEMLDAWRCVDGCPVNEMDRQSGLVSYGNKSGGYSYPSSVYKVEGFINNISPDSPSNYGDDGGASRYFINLEPENEFFY